MDEQLKIAQVGVGAWGESWVGILQQHPDVEISALVDLDLERCREVTEKYGMDPAICFRQLDEVIAGQAEVDAALVAVPPEHHEKVAVQALEAGLHCLIEKPLADTIDAGKRIIEAAEHSRHRAMVSQNYRFKRGPRTIRRLIREGKIGDIENVRVSFEKDPPFSGFRLEMPEPIIVDMAVHHLDQIRGTLGIEPQLLRARSWNPSWSRFRGNACAIIEMEDGKGTQVIYTASWVSHGRPTAWDGTWDIQGDRGGILWEQNCVEVRFVSLFDTVFLPQAFERGEVMGVELDEMEKEDRFGSLAEFVQAIREDREPETSAKDNLRTLALVLAAVESAESGGATIDVTKVVE